YVMVPPVTAASDSWDAADAANKKKLLAGYPSRLFVPAAARGGLAPGKTAQFGDAKQATAALRGEGFDLQTFMGGGVAVGDVDRDGYPDLFMTGEGQGKLYLNQGAGARRHFSDASAVWGIPPELDDAHATLFFDMEGDGDLDLLVI